MALPVFIRAIIFLASPRFQLIFFSFAAVGSWALLACSLSGAITPSGIKDWIAFMVGSVLWPCVTFSIWRDQNRVPPKPWNHEYWTALKHQDIQRLLWRRLSSSDVGDIFRGEFAFPPHLMPYTAEDLPFLREFIDREMTPEDELWIYDNGEEAWANLGGEWGFAVLHEGEVKAFSMVAIN